MSPVQTKKRTGPAVKRSATGASAPAASRPQVRKSEPDESESVSLLKADLIPKRIKKKDLEVFTNQLVIMLQAGCDITTGLETIALQTAHPVLRKTVTRLHEDIRGGVSLSKAMARHPKVFDQIYTSMVAAGEAAGMMSETLASLRDLIRKQIKMRGQLKGALTYPIILMVVAVGALAVLTTFVLPQFNDVFEKAGAELPAITKAVLGFSQGVADYKWLILAGIAAAIGGFMAFRKSDVGRNILDRLKLKFPIVGKVYKLNLLAQLMRSIGVLVESGLPLTDVVELTQATVKNVHYRRFFDVLTARIVSGKTITPAFRNSGLFRPDICQLVQTGEDTGRVGFVCKTISEYLEDELSESVKMLTTLLEPAIIVVMAGMIGLVAISVIEPMFSVSKAIK